MPEYRVAHLVALLRDAAMSTTYKPALLKALVRVCQRRHSTNIPLTELGHEFAKMYWSQTVVYHLRQAAVLSKEAEVVRRVRDLASRYNVRKFRDLPADGRFELEQSMARVLAIDVLRRFHRSAPSEMPLLYAWRPRTDFISLSQDSHGFLRDARLTLEVVANFYWARYLESCNRLAPRIIQKVSRDGAVRTGLRKFLSILSETSDGKCFYCESEFSSENPIAVDHFIPWTFLLEDPLWDLVPACACCNRAKSDSLPDRRYLDRLVQRNTRDLKARVGDKVSLLNGADDALKLYDAAIAVEWPAYWSPRVS